MHASMKTTLSARDLFMEEAVVLANLIIAGCAPNMAASYSESVFRWSCLLFKSPIHKANLEAIYHEAS